MAQRQVDLLGARRLETGKRQPQHFDIGIQPGVTEEFDANLHRAATALMLVGLGPQHRRAIAQTHGTLTLQRMGIHARDLRRHIGAGAHHSSGQLIGQLERLQIQIGAGTGQQRIEKFDRRRHDQVVAPAVVQVEQRPTQLLHPGCLRRQYFIHAVG